jgi:hypothetical protein
MADLGAIAVNAAKHVRYLTAPNCLTNRPHTAVLGIAEGVFEVERADTIGRLTPPSQVQRRPGILRDVLLPVNPGALLLTIWVSYAPDLVPRPRLRIKGDQAILGQTADLTADAPANPAGVGTWVQIRLPFDVGAAGVLEVWREYTQSRGDAECYWDRIQILRDWTS